MTFLNSATTFIKQTIYSKISLNHVTLHNIGLFKRAVDIRFVSTINQSHYSRRSSLCTSTRAKGSITIEAAIAFPIFFFFIMSLVYVINIMYVQTSIQIELENTARQLAKTAYISTEFYSLTTDEQTDISTEDSSIVENLGASIISTLYIKESFLTDDMKTFLDNSPIKNGADGISFSSCSIDMNESILDIILFYTVNIPFLPDAIASFNLSNRCYIRLYTGYELPKEQQETDFYVYYTSLGKVFHINKYCRYLLNYSDAVSINNPDLLTYLPCSLCITHLTEMFKETHPIVYTTEKGAVFHATLDCPSFTGSVFRIPYSGLKEKDDICEECLKGK